MSDVRSNLWQITIDPAKAGIESRYVDQATAQLNDGYNAQINALQQALDKQVADYEASKGNVNTQYDKNIEKDQDVTDSNKTNYANSAMSRGIGRSSIIQSAIAQYDDLHRKAIGDINSQRATALAGVDKQINDARGSFNNSRATMDTDRYNKIVSLARDLQERQKAADEDKRRWELQYALQKQQASRGGGGGGGGGSSKPLSASQMKSQQDFEYNTFVAPAIDAAGKAGNYRAAYGILKDPGVQGLGYGNLSKGRELADSYYQPVKQAAIKQGQAADAAIQRSNANAAVIDKFDNMNYFQKLGSWAISPVVNSTYKQLKNLKW